MATRKSNKKEQQSTWYTCEKCNRKITFNHLKLSHENNCEDFGVLNEIFTTKSINTSLPKEVDDPHQIFLQRYLFVPESICNFCNFTMDCKLLIEIGNRLYVRFAWPIADTHLDHVYSNSPGTI